MYTVDTIAEVHFVLLKAGADAASHACRMLTDAPSGEVGTMGRRVRILCDANVVVQAAAAALNAAASIAALTDYGLATGTVGTQL